MSFGSAFRWAARAVAASFLLWLALELGPARASTGSGDVSVPGVDTSTSTSTFTSTFTSTSTSTGAANNPNSTPHEFVTVGGATYFAANDPANGRELWKSDGTPAGTVMVKDIYPGVTGSGPSNLTGMNGAVYFQANDGSYGWELWKSDGTVTGTVLVKDVNPGPAFASPMVLTAVSNTLYFEANDGAHGYELWKSNGTPGGTLLVRDIFTGANCAVTPCGSFPDQFAGADGRLYFAADDGIHGEEVWVSDGTFTGTRMLADIYTGLCGSESVPCASAPHEFTAVSHTVFFNADSAIGRQLWKTDGTPGGTVLVRQISTATYGIGPAHMADLSGTLIFNVDDGVHGAELWRSDGAYTGTFMLKDIYTGIDSLGSPRSSFPAMMTPGNGVLYFSADDSEGRELWRTDGTANGTWRVADINPGEASSGPELKLFSNGLLFMIADGNNGAGRELWVSDGAAAGTHFVKDIYPNQCINHHPPPTTYPCSAFSDPYTGYAIGFAALPDARAIFRANDGVHGYEPWTSDGTLTGAVLLKDIAVNYTAFVPVVSLAPPSVWLSQSSLTIDTYNWQAGLVTATNPSDPIYPYPRLDAGRVNAKAPRAYATVVLENAYVRVTVLPEIGGRVIRWEDKTTGRLLTYANSVVKPAMTWGYRGWWLGTGGIEWAFPVDEHGLNEYRPWQVALLTGPDWRGVRVWDIESRTGLTIEITLKLFAGRSDLLITPRIANGTGQPRSFQFWINAMLTLSGANSPSSGLRFWVPTSQMKIHSTNDGGLPGPRGLIPWPVYNGRDFSRYTTWNHYAGLFATEWLGAAGAYDESSDQGIVRAYPPQTAQGVKLFCLGDLPSGQYTDDNSRYFEFWGGYNHTFFSEDYAQIQPGQSLSWDETWYPVHGLGGLSWANGELAAFLRNVGGAVTVGLHAAQLAQAHLVLRQLGIDRAEWNVQVAPETPFQTTYAGSGGGWTLQVWQNGLLVATLSEP